MPLWPTQNVNNDLPEQSTHISILRDAPVGLSEELLSFLGRGSQASSAVYPNSAIQAALMTPIYLQKPWRPIAMDWQCTAASSVNSTTIEYKWIITDVNGKVVSTTPIATTAVAIGSLTQSFTVTSLVLPEGLYYYGFAYSDSPVTSTTRMSVFSATASKFRAMGIKTWIYAGTGAQSMASMTVGATCTLGIPGTNNGFDILNSNIRCMINA